MGVGCDDVAGVAVSPRQQAQAEHCTGTVAPAAVQAVEELRPLLALSGSPQKAAQLLHLHRTQPFVCLVDAFRNKVLEQLWVWMAPPSRLRSCFTYTAHSLLCLVDAFCKKLEQHRRLQAAQLLHLCRTQDVTCVDAFHKNVQQLWLQQAAQLLHLHRTQSFVSC